MITRRHLAPPSRVDHGTYACYRDPYNPNILRETLVKGKRTIIDNKPAAGGKCSFRGPKKARYFYVQLIGGGGGGKELKESDYDPVRNADYQIKTHKLNPPKEGYLVGQSSNEPAYTDDIFPNGKEKDYNELVNNVYIRLFGQSGDGSTQSFQGETDDESSKRCVVYGVSQNALSDAPNRDCYGGRYNKNIGWTAAQADGASGGVTPGSDIYTNSTSCKIDSSICDNCNNLYIVKTSNHDYKCPLTLANDMKKVDCKNDKAGKGTDGYAYFKLSDIEKPINYSSHTTGNVYEVKPQEIGRYNDNFKRAANGNGVYFSFYDSYGSPVNLLSIHGGQGAEYGIPYERYPKVTTNYSKYCLEGDMYLEGQDGKVDLNSSYAYSDKHNASGYKGRINKSNAQWYDYTNLKFVQTDITQSQYLPYGVGGKAGELKTMILKEIPEGIDMVPGKGGKAGKPGEDTKLCFPNGTTQADCSNTSWPKDLVKPAKGGAAGENMYLWEIEINPYYDATTLQTTTTGKWRVGETVEAGARAGEKTKLESIIKFIISSANQTLRDLLMHFGEGGAGTAVRTQATCGADYQDIALMNGNTEIKSKPHETRKYKLDLWKGTDGKYSCNDYIWTTTNNATGDGYWVDAVGVDDDGKAQAGKSGAIVKRW